MYIKKFTFFAILIIAIFTGCEDKESINSDLMATPEYSAQDAAKASTDFTLKSLNTDDIKLKITNSGWDFGKYKGKIILLNFFATWCPPCKAEIPHFNEMREEWKDKFEIISLDIGQRDGKQNIPKDLQNFVTKYKIKYPVTYGNINNEIMGGLASFNKASSIPFSILFDQDGKFVKPYVGLVSNYVMREDIKKLFKDKK